VVPQKGKSRAEARNVAPIPFCAVQYMPDTETTAKEPVPLLQATASKSRS